MPTPCPAWLYILRLYSGTLYIGVTRDLSRRLREHAHKHGSYRTTSEDAAQALVRLERHATITSALRR